MRAVVLAPWRPGSPERERLWKFTRAWWAQNFPQLTIHTAAGPAGPFNRSAAINAAADSAGEWDVAVIIDTDTIPEVRNVTNAVELAASTGQMVVAHIRRHMLTRQGTDKVLRGYAGKWSGRQMVERIWPDSMSCCVVVSRRLFDEVGGFDPLFVGWGREDSAFQFACEAVTGRPVVQLNGESWHLWHPPAPEAKAGSPLLRANERRYQRYLAARWDRAAIQALLDEAQAQRQEATVELGDTTIPRILHRTVPADTTDEVERWWARFGELHPGWDLRTYREPIDPKDWPLTGDLFAKCQNGAQKAGLIRLEALVTHGGIYVDSDVEPHRSLEPLLHVPAFAGWEDETTVPDAVLGARPGHPAFEAMLKQARQLVKRGADAWVSGPGVATKLLPGRDDVLVLPPGALYPHHYFQKAKAGVGKTQPWCFVEHRWHHSWGSEAKCAEIARNQRP